MKMKIIFSCSDRNRTGLIFQTAFLSIKHMEFPLANENHMILRKIIQKRSINYRTCCVFSNNVGKWAMCA